MQWVRRERVRERGSWRSLVRGKIRIWNECRSDRCHCDDELGSEVCAQTSDETCWRLERNFFFNVEV